MNENTNAEKGMVDVKFAQPLYRCPVHGESPNCIRSTIPGHEGEWCQICWMEQLDKLGVHRVERVEASNGERHER
jgi:hypothetical protein